MSAAGLAAAIAAGGVSALEVTDAHLARIGEVDDAVHAFLHVAADGARQAARAVDERRAAGEVLGPLAGVPLALKDVFTTTDMPTTCGSAILNGWRPRMTRRSRGAPAGRGGDTRKTNMDEFAMGSSTGNSAFGPSHNPWDLGRVPGGSSGGSAAAVAAFERRWGSAPIPAGRSASRRRCAGWSG
jgi:aspartyl-tRNA(Asn)/glutamyl-tRNA(Gln) amidotransferase subunit A